MVSHELVGSSQGGSSLDQLSALFPPADSIPATHTCTGLMCDARRWIFSIFGKVHKTRNASWPTHSDKRNCPTLSPKHAKPYQ